MTEIFAGLTAALIIVRPIKADDNYDYHQDFVPSHWRTMAIGLALVLVIIIIITIVKDCLPRLLSLKAPGSINAEDPSISIISTKQLMPLGKNNIPSTIGTNFANGKRGSKQLSLDVLVAQTRRERSPSISVELATPSEGSPEDVKPPSPLSTEWVASSPPPPPPETLLWVPSTARRRSVSLRSDSDEENDEKHLCSYCKGNLFQSRSAGVSPTSSVPLERKRSVTFNQSVEEIHVLSNDPKRPRSRSASLLLSGSFYAR